MHIWDLTNLCLQLIPFTKPQNGWGWQGTPEQCSPSPAPAVLGAVPLSTFLLVVLHEAPVRHCLPPVLVPLDVSTVLWWVHHCFQLRVISEFTSGALYHCANRYCWTGLDPLFTWVIPLSPHFQLDVSHWPLQTGYDIQSVFSSPCCLLIHPIHHELLQQTWFPWPNIDRWRKNGSFYGPTQKFPLQSNER